MVSFMRYCTKNRAEDGGLRTQWCGATGFFRFLFSVLSPPSSALRRALNLFCILFSVLSPQSSVFAENIAVHKAEARLTDGSYQLSAKFDLRLNFIVDQALTRGVPLYFISEFTLIRPRWYWFDKRVVQTEQTTRLSYNALTRQYRIARGSLFQNFSTLDDALRIISHQSSAPIDASLLRQDEGYLALILPNKDGDYIAAARMRLDVTQLPKPLQVNALGAEDWNLDSDWYRWIVRPAAAISAADGQNRVKLLEEESE